MRSLFGALNTAVGAVVHVGTAGFLCRTCGKPVEKYLESRQCDECIRKGRR